MNRGDQWWAAVKQTVKPLERSSAEQVRPLTEGELRAQFTETLALDAQITKALAERPVASRFLQKPHAPIPLPVSPSTLDLHGLTVTDAYRASIDFVENSGRKSMTIITGKSGQIRREFERWMEGLPRVHSCVEKHGGGAFTIRILKRCR
jgi:DNA-nicking Smr family endonuclease